MQLFTNIKNISSDNVEAWFKNKASEAWEATKTWAHDLFFQPKEKDYGVLLISHEGDHDELIDFVQESCGLSYKSAQNIGNHLPAILPKSFLTREDADTYAVALTETLQHMYVRYSVDERGLLEDVLPIFDEEVNPSEFASVPDLIKESADIRAPEIDISDQVSGIVEASDDVGDPVFINEEQQIKW